jgi:hypothetical protein
MSRSIRALLSLPILTAVLAHEVRAGEIALSTVCDNGEFAAARENVDVRASIGLRNDVNRSRCERGADRSRVEPLGALPPRLEFDASVVEEGASTYLQIIRTTPADVDLAGEVLSTHSLEHPATFVIPAGRAAVRVPIGVLDDAIAQGTRFASLTVQGPQFQPLLKALKIVDDDSDSIYLSYGRDELPIPNGEFDDGLETWSVEGSLGLALDRGFVNEPSVSEDGTGFGAVLWKCVEAGERDGLYKFSMAVQSGNPTSDLGMFVAGYSSYQACLDQTEDASSLVDDFRTLPSVGAWYELGPIARVRRGGGLLVWGDSYASAGQLSSTFDAFTATRRNDILLEDGGSSIVEVHRTGSTTRDLVVHFPNLHKRLALESQFLRIPAGERTAVLEVRAVDDGLVNLETPSAAFATLVADSDVGGAELVIRVLDDDQRRLAVFANALVPKPPASGLFEISVTRNTEDLSSTAIVAISTLPAECALAYGLPDEVQLTAGRSVAGFRFEVPAESTDQCDAFTLTAQSPGFFAASSEIVVGPLFKDGFED